MKELYELKDKLCEELKQYGKKDMSAGSLDVIDKLTHTIKNLDKVIEGYEGENYSGYGRMYPYSMDGNSYAMGRRNARRDSMGRYSRNNSYGNEEMIEELRGLMHDAPDNKTREEFQRFIDRIESM